MKKIQTALAALLMLLASCSVLKQADCKKKFVKVTVVSDYGTYDLQVPYCDTVYIGKKKPPDSLVIQYKKD